MSEAMMQAAKDELAAAEVEASGIAKEQAALTPRIAASAARLRKAQSILAMLNGEAPPPAATEAPARKRRSSAELDAVATAVLAALQGRSFTSAATLAPIVGLDIKAVSAALASLYASGKISKVGSGRTTTYKIQPPGEEVVAEIEHAAAAQ